MERLECYVIEPSWPLGRMSTGPISQPDVTLMLQQIKLDEGLTLFPFVQPSFLFRGTAIVKPLRDPPHGTPQLAGFSKVLGMPINGSDYSPD